LFGFLAVWNKTGANKIFKSSTFRSGIDFFNIPPFNPPAHEDGSRREYKAVQGCASNEEEWEIEHKIKATFNQFPSQMKLHPSGQLQISGLARASIKALGFLHCGSCVLQDFPSPEQMGCHINHEADDHYRLRGLIWESDHKTTPPSFCHLFPQTGGSASLRNSKPQPMPSTDIIQTCSPNRCLIWSHLLLTTAQLMINITAVLNEHYNTVDTFHVGSRHRQKPYRLIIMETSVVQRAPKRSQRHNELE